MASFGTFLKALPNTLQSVSFEWKSPRELKGEWLAGIHTTALLSLIKLVTTSPEEKIYLYSKATTWGEAQAPGEPGY